MATPVRIPQENTVYDWILTSMNNSKYNQAIAIYNNLSHQEQVYFMKTYPEIYGILYKVYMAQKMTTTTHTFNS